ncbi:hypothetical protein DM02DRAFT_534280 [Periconia macrospinosa]|uniref:Uncharacterized protein n=1 Tax=Periconia macrospinosa TaxID=97972 RepID=A0A2V1DFL6_9PLEO|nr:hypothetical protein DM02DRAFT_534280 [Periconia macrospinosa]
MDFSNNAFRARPTPTLSKDNISHAKLVQSCRFGWSAGPNDTEEPCNTPAIPAPAPSHTVPSASLPVDRRAKRLTPCRGRLYHQLTCSHRVRTDLVEDCGMNCLEPYTANTSTNTIATISPIPFYCQECVDREAARIWDTRSAELNSQYPPMNNMTADEYNRWYEEHQTLQAQYTVDRAAYELQQRVESRPTNICSALEMSKEEEAFARELDGLSLSLMASSSSTSTPLPSTITTRITLPSDASEQLHWGLNSLAIDRGSCGVEYSTSTSSPVQTSLRQQQVGAEEDAWRPRGKGKGT